MPEPTLPSGDATRILARFAAGIRFESLPEDVVDRAKLCIMDCIGVTLGGSSEAAVRILVEVIKECGGTPQATVVGWGFLTSVLNACLANGTMAHVLDYDDVHVGSEIHPSAPLVPAVLALGEWKHNTGREVICAFTAGFETEAALGMVSGRQMLERGFHPTGVLGALGAAASAGNILGLTEQEMTMCFSVAATQASGLVGVFGTMCKPLHVGNAAMAGVLSALLAKRQFKGAVNIFEGQKRFLHAFSGCTPTVLSFAEVGSEFAMRETSFKTYASCHCTHPPMAAIRMLTDGRPIKGKLVREVQCYVNPLVLEIAGNPRPRNGLEAKFSLQYCIALMLLEGDAGDSQFVDEKLQGEEIRNLAGRVRIIGDPELRYYDQAVVRIKTVEGKDLVQRVSDAPPEASREELENKYRRLAGRVLSGDQVEESLDHLRRLEALEDITKLLHTLGK